MDIALHDTYYVVAPKLICSLLPFATLPAGFVEYKNLDESKGLIRTSFLKQRSTVALACALYMCIIKIELYFLKLFLL